MRTIIKKKYWRNIGQNQLKVKIYSQIINYLPRPKYWVTILIFQYNMLSLTASVAVSGYRYRGPGFDSPGATRFSE
jgi:hypothetical protein